LWMVFDELMVVLVIYKMEVNESSAFQSLTKALQSVNKKASIFIYDNSPIAHQHTQAENWKITYQSDTNNPGVSKAYNEGFEQAKLQTKKWLLLVDQDTVFPLNTFEQYQIAMEKFNCPIIVPRLIDSTGIVSPLKFYFGGGQRLSRIRTKQLVSLKDFFFHNSGLLVSLDEFESAGKYDETFPLDFSDFSFVHRLRKRNDYFLVANVEAFHNLATNSPSNFTERFTRFSSYLKAGRFFKNKYQSGNPWIVWRLFLRAIKLAFQYRNFKFIVLYFR